MPDARRRPEIVPLAFAIGTPFVLPLLWLVAGQVHGPLGSPFVPDNGDDVLEVAMSVGIWGLLLLFVLYQMIATAFLMAVGAGSVWLLGRLLRLPARGVLSWTAVGWLGWGVGLALTVAYLLALPGFVASQLGVPGQ